jgi:hypothetical protein
LPRELLSRGKIRIELNPAERGIAILRFQSCLITDEAKRSRGLKGTGQLEKSSDATGPDEPGTTR